MTAATASPEGTRTDRQVDVRTPAGETFFLFGLLRTNFIIQRPGDDRVIGEFNRRLTFFDRYVLDLSADREHALDRRLAVALGVLLDTGERR